MFLIVAKNTNVGGKMTQLSFINQCKKYWIKYAQFSYTFSIKAQTIIIHSCIYKYFFGFTNIVVAYVPIQI